MPVIVSFAAPAEPLVSVPPPPLPPLATVCAWMSVLTVSAVSVSVEVAAPEALPPPLPPNTFCASETPPPWAEPLTALVRLTVAPVPPLPACAPAP